MNHFQYLCKLCNDAILDVITIIKNKNDKDYSDLLLFLQLIEDDDWVINYQIILDSRKTTSTKINIPCKHLVFDDQKICSVCHQTVTKYISPYTTTIYTNDSYNDYIFGVYDKYVEYLENK